MHQARVTIVRIAPRAGMRDANSQSRVRLQTAGPPTPSGSPGTSKPKGLNTVQLEGVRGAVRTAQPLGRVVIGCKTPFAANGER